MKCFSGWARGLAFISTLAIGGCSLPLEPKYDRNALKEKAQLAAAPNVKDVRNISEAWALELEDAARNRRIQNLLANEVLFYGSLMFSAGALQSAPISSGWRRIRNIGAGAAAGSELMRSHYQPQDQALAFQHAAVLMRCMIKDLQKIPSEAEYLAIFDQGAKDQVNTGFGNGEDDIDLLYNAVPGHVLHFIEQVVMPKLQADLTAITLGTPSKAELLAVLEKYKNDKEAGEKAAKSLKQPTKALDKYRAYIKNQEVSQDALTLKQKSVVSALKTFEAELLLCNAPK